MNETALAGLVGLSIVALGAVALLPWDALLQAGAWLWGALKTDR